MKFISEKQFLEEPKEIQNVLKEWWNPSIGDLYKLSTISKINVLSTELEGFYKLQAFKEQSIPLFTLQQLIDFIEDTTKCEVDICNCDKEGIYILIFTKGNHPKTIKEELVETNDLLIAMWKVACKVAREVAGEDD